MTTRDIIVLGLAVVAGVALSLMDLFYRFNADAERSLDTVAVISVLYGFYKLGRRPPDRPA